MPLTKRDKSIIEDLARFRVMDRDSIAELYFKGLKNPKFAANNVLLRLVREQHIQRTTHYVPYCYFPYDSTIKKSSAKIPHFLAILETYKEILRYGKLKVFQVEPKYGKKSEGAEPDALFVYRDTPFFLEVQKSIYSEKQMKDKLERYVDLYNSGVILDEPWQKPSNAVFPRILILSEQRYAIDDDYPFKIFQAQSFSQFVESLKGDRVEPQAQKTPVKKVTNPNPPQPFDGIQVSQNLKMKN